MQCSQWPQAVEPGHAHAVAFLHALDAGTDGRDEAHALVPRNEGQRRLHGPVAIGGVKIGVAHARGDHFHEHLASCDLRNGNFLDLQGLAEFPYDGSLHGLHGLVPQASTASSLTTETTPGADQAAPRTASSSAQERTLPRSTTCEP